VCEKKLYNPDNGDATPLLGLVLDLPLLIVNLMCTTTHMITTKMYCDVHIPYAEILYLHVTVVLQAYH